MRLDTVTYAGSGPVTVTSVSVVYDGSAMTGLTVCPDSWAQPDTLVWGLEIDPWVRRSGSSAYWTGTTTVQTDGPFTSLTVQANIHGFTQLSPGDQIFVEQYYLAYPTVDTCVPILPYPSGEFTRATLRLEVTSPLAAEESTWGRVKALYRR